MSALMPDGERFSGSTSSCARDVLGRIEPAWAGDDPVGTQGDIDNSTWGAPRDRATFISAHLNKAIARLKVTGAPPCFAASLSTQGSRPARRRAGECQTRRGEDHRAVLVPAIRRLLVDLLLRARQEDGEAAALPLADSAITRPRGVRDAPHDRRPAGAAPISVCLPIGSKMLAGGIGGIPRPCPRPGARTPGSSR